MGARGLPLVGRRETLEDITALVGSGVSVVLSGPAGIGKTRLARELCSSDLVPSGSVERALATEETRDRPLGTLLALGVVRDGDDLVGAFGRVMKRWSGRAGPRGPALLWLDDAHDADRSSAALIRHAVMAGELRLVATHREHRDLPPDLEALVTEGMAERRVVGPLPDAHIARVGADAVAPAALSPRAVRSVIALAGGNPLYARELARAAARGDGDLSSGPSLDLLVGRAVLGLDPTARRVLDMVAVAEPAPLGLFRGRRDSVDRLRRDGLVHPHGDDALRIDHPLRRSWLLRELGPHRADVLQALLDHLSSAPDASPDAVTLLHWHDGAGRPADPALLERAARSAVARGRAREAREIADRLDGGIATLLRAESLVVGGDVEAGLAVLDELAERGPGSVRLEALWWSVRYHAIAFGATEQAEEVLRAVEEADSYGADALAGASPPDRVGRNDLGVLTVLSARLWLWVYRGAGPEADLDLVTRQVLSLPPGAERFEMLAALLAVIANTRGIAGTGPLVEELAAADDRFDGWPPERLHGRLALGSYRAAGLCGDDAVTTLLRAHREARRRHDYEAVFALGAAGGLVAAACGRVRAALEVSSAVVAPNGGREWLRFDEQQRVTLAGTRCYAGEPERAAAELELLADAGADEGPEPSTMLLLRLRRLVAETGGCSDDSLVPRAVARVSRRKQLLWLALVSLETIDLAAGTAAVETVAAALPTRDEGIIDVASRSFATRLQGDAEGLLGQGLRLERGGLVVPALRVVADAVRIGEDDAVRGEGRAVLLRLLARWDGVEPWWLDPVPTPRQREVAGRIAGGETPTEVADSLVISRRTVENHLHQVYTFLDVHSRDGLVAALAPR
jgi:DNA-binding CsgD family transcriptional regulator